MLNEVLGGKRLCRTTEGGEWPLAAHAEFDDFRAIYVWLNQDSSPITTSHSCHVSDSAYSNSFSSLNSAMTEVSLCLQFFHCIIRIIINNSADLFNIFRCCFGNRSSRSRLVFNIFSTFTKPLRPSGDSPKRRHFVAENSASFIMNYCWLNIKCSMHLKHISTLCLHYKFSLVL